MFDLFGDTARGEARSRIFRVALVLAGLGALVVAAGFLAGWPALLRIWPYLGYGLTPLFLASILAAVAVPVIWIGISGEFAAIRGGAANLLLTAGGIAAYSVYQAWGDPVGRVQTFATVNLAVATIALLLLVVSQHVPWRDMRGTPALVRIAFGIFGLGLVVVGTALVLGQDIFPWRLDRDSRWSMASSFLGRRSISPMGCRGRYGAMRRGSCSGSWRMTSFSLCRLCG